MNHLEQIKYFYKIKEVERRTSVLSRRESVGEHIFSMLILTQYLLKLSYLALDYQKLTKILLHHDIAEIESGDVFVFDQIHKKEQWEKEIGLNQIVLSPKIPEELREEYLELTADYINKTSIESRYASGIDALDPMIQSLDKKDDWIGFEEEKIRKHNQHRVEEFPEQKQLFEEIIQHLKEIKYI